MATKVTFTFDEATISRLKDAAERLQKPKSQVVREAIHDYSERIGRLSERERLHMLKVFDEMVSQIPTRPQAEVKKELREIRRARRAWARRPQ
jgi:hypothetical protein